MNTTFKRGFAILLAVLMLVGTVCLSACGGKTGNDKYYIGATGPLTGDAADYGIAVNNGAMLAIEEINAAGGLNGVLFHYEMKDDKATAADATIGYNALMDDGMQISIGSVTSGSCEAFAAEAVKDNLFFMTPSASTANVIADRPNAFRVCFGDPDQGILAAQALAAGYEKIGVIYDTSDPYSYGIYEAFESEMNKLGKAYEVKTFDKDNNKDFSAQVEALKECDVIFLPFYYTEAGLMAKKCAEKGCTADLYGCDGLDGIAGQIDESVTNHIKYITPFDVNATDEKTANFVKKYRETYGKDPSQFAADGYDAIYVIFEAMKAAGVDDVNISVSDLCHKVVAAITAESFQYVGTTGTMTWDVSGAATKVPVIVELQ
ncbi:MAG: ABC transporter substrate-binding protein [Clostridia bacterium]|nr:ABC transporter substrate-binding protein [Clostridia bacterium]